MGRRLVEATKACRILRTRGEIGLLRFLALTLRPCVEPIFGFFAPAVLPLVAGFVAAPAFAAGFETFGLAGVL
jgi:hypothetical protein